MRKEDVIGAWQLVGWQNRRANGDINLPMGKSPVGLNIYTASGHMSGQIMRAGRPAFAVEHMRRGTDNEVRAAFEGYLAYFGRYDYDPERGIMLHHPDGALFPNWVGMTQTRYVSFDGTLLSLSTPPVVINGIEQVGVLTWRKIGEE